jgi:hypothetical protein
MLGVFSRAGYGIGYLSYAEPISEGFARQMPQDFSSCTILSSPAVEFVFGG